MATIDWNKVREAMRTLGGLNADETEALFTIVSAVNENRESAAKPEPVRPVTAPASPGPSPRATRTAGGIACPFCGARFGTPHGVKIHFSRMHKNGELFQKENK